MPRRLAVCLMLSLVCACATEQPAAEQPRAGATQPAERAALKQEPEPVNAPSILITADEAAAAGLPRLGLSLDTTDTGMSGSKFIDGRYLILSGPPGGPLMLRISPATVDATFAELVGEPGLVEESIELLGETRRAAAWISGASHARTSWCAVLIAPPGAQPGGPALLLEAGIGHQGEELRCATALASESLAAVISSLKLLS